MIAISGSATISKDFELSTSKTGNPYIRLPVRTKTSKKGTDGKYLWDFVNLFITEPKNIEYLTNYCQKGSTIEFVGRFEQISIRTKKALTLADIQSE
ncbi:hypothetical protein AGMMS49921_02330 [Endomicrobiia bacterium]|nr:hypothetical protein AGMMS49921_02330 [Endomicrobiia bacterium]